ncbi:P-loop containing nucleoside triphosphate hydrolase protein [Phaeosphaeria sp. MPI-PUGE-AT-0046c]|nr:P-loop containing nucleoside triphosphate hydrolase protein [Phaeosphaeria sp. MPI-PUGE-AT-0046c]
MLSLSKTAVTAESKSLSTPHTFRRFSARSSGISRFQYVEAETDNISRYFPEVYVERRSISFSYPYAPFYYYIDQMQEFVENDKDEDVKRCDWDDFRKHFYDVDVGPFHDQVRASLDEANVRFDNLWAVFKPGDMLYTLDDFDEPHLFVIGASTFRGRKYGADDFENIIWRGGSASAGSSERFVIDAWTVTWKGSSKVFSRSVKTFTINFFAGTRAVSSFKIYPVQYHQSGDTEAQKQLLDSLEDRGRMWAQLVSKEPISKHHEGPARELNHKFGRSQVEEERLNLSERVIVDHDGVANFGQDKTIKALEDWVGPIMDRLSSLFDQEQSIKGGGYDSVHMEYDWHPPEKPITTMQAQLCPSVINCFTLATNKWYLVSVKNLKEVNWTTTAFDHLVMDKQYKTMLRGLVEQHRSNKNKILADVIRGKGKGLVILLHGPPGVGKTLTAESVAEYTHKPLYSLNIGELTAEDKVASRLQNVFVSAARWDAVLLLDEADVILEKRSFEDFKRNGIVSVFLRMLEYYEGILFLTTNRLSTMDAAFQSRIHIAIKFTPLKTNVRRAIWKAFIERLDESESIGQDELLDNLEALSELELNGREIRNVLTIAQSLALAKRKSGGGLRYEHVNQVADETINFRAYFRKAEEENKDRAMTNLPDTRRKGLSRAERMHDDY